MIEIKNLTKRYGDKYAVKNVSFTINQGEILGFLGRNGAGKSTTMNIITGYISSTSGSVTVDGYDILEHPLEAKRHIGYLPELPPVYPDMTVNEYMKFACDIKGVEKHSQKSHIEEIYSLVRLEEVRGRLIKNLSKGYRQRVGFAQALVGNPDVIILDEPTVGLDPRQIIEIRKLIRDLGKNHTVVLSSHILHEVADVCERLVIINQGEIVAQDTLENLTHGISETSRLDVRVAAPANAAQKVIRSLPGVRYTESMGTKEPGTVDIIVETDQQTDVRRAMFNALARNSMPILMLRSMDMTLEDIFLRLTSEEKEA